MSFTIAIIGRPNVGKSTLFNRLVGQKLALVDDEPGVTRDRREGEGRLGDLSFKVIDTAGLGQGAAESPSGRIAGQARRSVLQGDRYGRPGTGRAGEPFGAYAGADRGGNGAGGCRAVYRRRTR